MFNPKRIKGKVVAKLDLLSKDSFINLRGKWLYEIAELEGLKRVEETETGDYGTDIVYTKPTK